MLSLESVISRISFKNTKSNWQKTKKGLEENSDMPVFQIVAVDVVQHLSRRETIFSRSTISQQMFLKSFTITGELMTKVGHVDTRSNKLL